MREEMAVWVSIFIERVLSWLGHWAFSGTGWFRDIINYNILSLVAPIQPALRALSGGMIALESLAKCLISLTVPDGLNWFLEDVAQYTLLFVLLSTPMPKRSETARKDITTRGNVGQRV